MYKKVFVIMVYDENVARDNYISIYASTVLPLVK